MTETKKGGFSCSKCGEFTDNESFICDGCGVGKPRQTIYDFAKKLNGREYGQEISKQEALEAKELGFVVVFGCSDDLCEFRGAIYDEVGCYGGGTAYFIKDRLLNGCEDDYEALTRQATNELLITRDYAPEGIAFWEYQFKWHVEFAEFDILEDETPYCKGIVFRLADLAQ